MTTKATKTNTIRHQTNDPFLIRKWEHAFLTFFDVNHNGTLEWDDFDLLINIIGSMRGEKSDEYLTARLALPEIWHRLTEVTGRSHESQITLQDWIEMWQKSSGAGVAPKWQQHYLDYMFKLLDASGDNMVDQAEYIQVLSYFDIGRTESITCFDKFAKNEAGHNVMMIDQQKFCQLWDEYFHSTDMNAVGNYLLGFID